MENIELSEMLGQLREELIQAQRKGKDSKLKFMIEDIEIELQIATTKSGESGGGVKLSVINFGAKVNASEVETQKLKLKLKLVEDGKPIPIAGRGAKPR
ncbi:MAG: trypco2 family protein [Candidatus Competibacteraceae bacterium]